jgi:NAD(P)H-flavin reductase
VGASGPSGTLVWKADVPSLLIATGTGLSPLRALAREQLQRPSQQPVVLLFGCRDRSEELWGAELRALHLRCSPLAADDALPHVSVCAPSAGHRRALSTSCIHTMRTGGIHGSGRQEGSVLHDCLRNCVGGDRAGE